MRQSRFWLAAACALALLGGRAADALACATVGQVTLVDGSCLTVSGVTFTVANCLACNASSGDVMVRDGSNLGVTIENTTSNYLLKAHTATNSTNNGTNADLGFSLDVSGSGIDFNKVLLAINGVVTGGTATAIDKFRIGTSETVFSSSNVQLGAMYATLANKSASTSFSPGQSALTLTKDLSVLGSTVHDNCTGSGAAETCQKHNLFLTSVTQDLVPVPEPGSLSLLAAGVAGLLAMRRRRR